MKPQSDKFEEDVDSMFEEKQNQKWKMEFLRKVQDTINLTKNQWRHKFEVVLRNQLTFDAKVKEYEKELRDKLMEEFRATSMKEKTEEQLIEIFSITYEDILKKAKEENPPLDVKDAALNAYRSNSTIASLGIDLLSEKGKL